MGQHLRRREIEAAMVERAEREPTVEEIVVALRETERGVDRVPPFTVVGGQPRGIRGSVAARGHSATATATATADTQNGTSGAADLAALRDGEIERLLAENAHLNERVMFLLKVIEREQAHHAIRAAEPAAIETDRGAIFHDVSAALQAELRPILLVLLRLLEKQRADPAEEDAHRAGRQAARPAAPQAAAYDADGIVDFDAPRA
jgi:hypothetical protein